MSQPTSVTTKDIAATLAQLTSQLNKIASENGGPSSDFKSLLPGPEDASSESTSLSTKTGATEFSQLMSQMQSARSLCEETQNIVMNLQSQMSSQNTNSISQQQKQVTGSVSMYSQAESEAQSIVSSNKGGPPSQSQSKSRQIYNLNNLTSTSNSSNITAQTQSLVGDPKISSASINLIKDADDSGAGGHGRDGQNSNHSQNLNNNLNYLHKIMSTNSIIVKTYLDHLKTVEGQDALKMNPEILERQLDMVLGGIQIPEMTSLMSKSSKQQEPDSLTSEGFRQHIVNEEEALYKSTLKVDNDLVMESMQDSDHGLQQQDYESPRDTKQSDKKILKGSSSESNANGHVGKSKKIKTDAKSMKSNQNQITNKNNDFDMLKHLQNYGVINPNQIVNDARDNGEINSEQTNKKSWLTKISDKIKSLGSTSPSQDDKNITSKSDSKTAPSKPNSNSKSQSKLLKLHPKLLLPSTVYHPRRKQDLYLQGKSGDYATQEDEYRDDADPGFRIRTMSEGELLQEMKINKEIMGGDGKEEDESASDDEDLGQYKEAVQDPNQDNLLEQEQDINMTLAQVDNSDRQYQTVTALNTGFDDDELNSAQSQQQYSRIKGELASPDQIHPPGGGNNTMNFSNKNIQSNITTNAKGQTQSNENNSTNTGSNSNSSVRLLPWRDPIYETRMAKEDAERQERRNQEAIEREAKDRKTEADADSTKTLENQTQSETISKTQTVAVATTNAPKGNLQAILNRTGISSATATSSYKDPFYPVQMGHQVFDSFPLRVVFERGRTGFEESKNFQIRIGEIIAGRYKCIEYLGSAAFSTAICVEDMEERELLCLKIIKNDKDYFDQSLDEIKLLAYINGNAERQVKERRIGYYGGLQLGNQRLGEYYLNTGVDKNRNSDSQDQITQNLINTIEQNSDAILSQIQYQNQMQQILGRSIVNKFGLGSQNLLNQYINDRESKTSQPGHPQTQYQTQSIVSNALSYKSTSPGSKTQSLHTVQIPVSYEDTLEGGPGEKTSGATVSITEDQNINNQSLVSNFLSSDSDGDNNSDHDSESSDSTDSEDHDDDSDDDEETDNLDNSPLLMAQAAGNGLVSSTDKKPQSSMTNNSEQKIKSINMNKIDPGDEDSPFYDPTLDLSISSGADALSVLKLKDCFYHKEHLILVTELLKDNLYEYQKFLRDNGYSPYFSKKRIQSISKQILTALKFIHGLNLIHSDLKPENILLKSYSRAEVKVIDFGSSCFVEDQLSSYVQSRSYRAPEIILGYGSKKPPKKVANQDFKKPARFDQKVDIWSLGCILSELYTGYVLFQNDSIQSLLARVSGIVGPFPDRLLKRGVYTPNYFTQDGRLYEQVKTPELGGGGGGSQNQQNFVNLLLPKNTTLAHRLMLEEDDVMLDFIRRMLQLDPEKRWSAEECLKHPFLTEVEYYEEEEIIGGGE